MELAQRVAAKAVRRVLAGEALGASLGDNPTHRGAQPPLARELAYGTLRFLGQVRHIAGALADRPFADRSVEALLCVALYQLIHTSAPPPAVVDSAVRATGSLKRTSAKGLTNAILRGFLRRRDVLLADAERDPESRFSYPRWWIDRVHSEYPGRAAEILDAGNARPPLTLRVNRRAIECDAFLARLKAQDIDAEAVGASGVIVVRPRAIHQLPGFEEGWFSVQDAGAQLAAALLGAEDGMRVLDACAAPGGKTTHIAELADVDLLALDVDDERLRRVVQNLDRLRLAARVIHADAALTRDWWNGVGFDRILIDAPCTASGVVRRHPDAKWLRRETDIANFAQRQRNLLDALWPCLVRGGAMLYATCSLFRAENDDQIAVFLAAHADAKPVPLALPKGSIGGQLLPGRAGAAHNHDGFFYALVQKT